VGWRGTTRSIVIMKELNKAMKIINLKGRRKVINELL
jgi:hypothetical protein